ncbi:AAA family ATPase [Rhizobium mongolense]|uniref:AAA family ATPase n=1 Tax=Rhizobium mongolense TaxID=57676 RepID=UPI0034A1BC64
MQHFDRTDEPAPACLSDERSREAREMLRKIFTGEVGTIAQTGISMAPVMVTDPELDLASANLFRGRCAFCEARETTRAYRFRPIEEAGPSDMAPPEDADRSHLYYSWLVNAWQNIYAVCSACSPTEPSIFPVVGRRCHLPNADEIETYADSPVGLWRRPINERSWFLDPCGNEDFRRNLAALPNGNLIGLSGRGEGTVRHFNLDRPELVSRRARAFQGYLQALLKSAHENTGTNEHFAFASMEFGGGWFLLLYQIAKKLGGGGGSRPTLSRKRIGQYYGERFGRQDFIDRVEEAFQDLYDRPEQLTQKRATPIAPVRGDARPVAFTIENFKALERVAIELKAQAVPKTTDRGSINPSAPSLIILGENAAGKSSILEAMALALCRQEVRDDLSLDATRFMLNPAMMGMPVGSERREGSVRVLYENDSVATMKVGSEFPFMEGADIPRIPVFAYGAFRLFLQAEKRARNASPVRSLFESNYVLANPEKWLASLAGKPLFAEVVRRLKPVLGIDQEIDVVEVGPEPDECSLLVSINRPGQAPLQIRTPFSAVSSGFRSVLAMICDVMRGLVEQQDQLSASLANSRAVVLIDEVEAHLHPKWKMRIIQGLREALPNVTFIMTTHDPLCLRGLAAEDVRVFRRVQRLDSASESELPTYVEQLEQVPALGALTIEQLLTSDLFQLHSTDAPELEDSLARAGDLLAKERERAADPASEPDIEKNALAEVRQILGAQIGKAIPIGNTEVERLIQEAVEQYLVERRGKRPKEMKDLRKDTRDRIVNALEGL